MKHKKEEPPIYEFMLLSEMARAIESQITKLKEFDDLDLLTERNLYLLEDKVDHLETIIILCQRDLYKWTNYRNYSQEFLSNPTENKQFDFMNSEPLDGSQLELFGANK